MKENLLKSAIIILLGILLWGCQSAEELNAPEELNKKSGNNSPVSITPVNTVPGSRDLR